MPYPTFAAGMTLTAGLLSDMQWQYVEQPSDQSVTNSVTLVDTDIVIPVVSGARYRYRLLVTYVGSSSGDLRIGWSLPTDGNVDRWVWALGNGATGGVNSVDAVVFRKPSGASGVPQGAGAVDTSTAQSYHEEGWITAGSSGNVVLQFAQDTVNSTATTLRAGSHVWYLRVE